MVCRRLTDRTRLSREGPTCGCPHRIKWPCLARGNSPAWWLAHKSQRSWASKYAPLDFRPDASLPSFQEVRRHVYGSQVRMQDFWRREPPRTLTALRRSP